MQVQWYPGHMNKAAREMEAILPQIDVFVEILDARIPHSSQNPMLATLRGDKPCIRILNKQDLADPETTALWIENLSCDEHMASFATSKDNPAPVLQLPHLCHKLLGPRKKGAGDAFVLISGIPNVGKSTIINTMAGRSIARTGNEPAITKGQQRINLRNGTQLYDTPGVLWPNIEHPSSGYRLAVTGAVRDTAMDYQSAADFAASFLMKHHPDRLCQRYDLAEIPATERELLLDIGRYRGAIRRGGVVDLEKTSNLFVRDIRDGSLGPLSFETPAIAASELLELEDIRERKAAKKIARKSRHMTDRDRDRDP